MGRAPCCDKANVKRGPWSPEEDSKLKAYIEQYGTGGNWIALPQKIGLKRCGKSCRLRWLNYLRPNIKHGGFSEEEDNIICSLYISIGSRWSIIAAQLPGRTDNDIKNYWNTRLKKKLLGRHKDSPSRRMSPLNQDPKDVNRMEDNNYSHTLSNSALERLHLHMQLQSLQNPFSFYNPALWPKLHPFGEKTMQANHGLIDGPPALMQVVVPDTQTEPCQNVEFEKLQNASIEHERANSANINPNQDELEKAITFNVGADPMNIAIMPKSNGIEQYSNMTNQLVPGIQAEFSDILYNKTGGFVEHEDHINDFDCFKEMDGAKESMFWWGNNIDTKSSSSNSWDSSSVLQPEGLFQDYVLGYDL